MVLLGPKGSLLPEAASLTLCTERSSKWIKHLNVRPEAIKLLEENTRSMLSGISLSNHFWALSPRGRESEAQRSKRDDVKQEVSAQ